MPASKSKLSPNDLHFVIRVNHQNGFPIYLMILMDLMNRLHIEQTAELPDFRLPSDSERGIPVLDMTNFKKVEIVQVLDEMPQLKEHGRHLLGTIYKTELRVWDVIRQEITTMEMDATQESHLLFDIDYRYDTVNLLSLYNHTHREEVVAMIIKQGQSAKILLFDVRLEAIDLTRHSGQESFIRFLKNFREGFVHFAEAHYPDGYVLRAERHIGDYMQAVRFQLPDHMPMSNKVHFQRLLHHLYSLKIILAASLLDRTDFNTEAYERALEYFRRYAPANIDDPEAVIHPKVIRMRNRNRQPAQTPSLPSVVFGLPQLEDLFDEGHDRPMRAVKKPATPPRSRQTGPTEHVPRIGESIKVDRSDVVRPPRRQHISIKVGQPVENSVWDKIVIEPEQKP